MAGKSYWERGYKVLKHLQKYELPDLEFASIMERLEASLASNIPLSPVTFQVTTPMPVTGMMPLVSMESSMKEILSINGINHESANNMEVDEEQQWSPDEWLVLDDAVEAISEV